MMDTRRRLNLKRRVWDRDGGICWICELPVPLAEVTLDHEVPKSKGGKTTFSNLRAAHSSCNNERGNHPERTGKTNLPKKKGKGKRRSRRPVPSMEEIKESMSRLAGGRPADVEAIALPDGRTRVVWVEK